MKRYGKCEGKVVWIVKWYGKYVRKVKAAAAAEAAPASSTALYAYTFCIYIVFQNWEESSWNRFFFTRDYASRDQTGYLVPPEWHSEHIRKHCSWKVLLNYIIFYENKMAGQITRAKNVRRGRPREHPMGHFRLKAPLGRILNNIRLRMRTPLPPPPSDDVS